MNQAILAINGNDPMISTSESRRFARWRSTASGTAVSYASDVYHSSSVSESVCLFLNNDGVQIAWHARSCLSRYAWDYLNAKFQAAGLIYRVQSDATVTDGQMAWPIRNGMIFDRDPEQNRARLAAEALGSSPT